MIELQHIHKRYEKKENQVDALKDVNLTINKGEIYGVIGYSGAGKSTLIRLVNFLDRPTEGEVIIDGEKLSEQSPAQLREIKKEIGMVFQHFNLLESKTIFKNVAMPLILAKKSKEEINERVTELLDFVGLADKATNYPGELSGGQKQRVGIARALASNPKILLCDEATSALDPQTTDQILSLLKKVNREYGITIMIITHEMSVIQRNCHRVAVMEQGVVIEEGSVLEVFAHPQHRTTKNFVQTVVKTDIPEKIKQAFIEQGKNQFVKLELVGETREQALLQKLVKDFEVNVDVVFTNTVEIQETLLAIWYLSLDGTPDQINKLYAYLKEQQIRFEEVEVR